MKKNILFLILILFLSAIANAQEMEEIREDFNTNENSWREYDTTYSEAFVRDGVYSIACKNRNYSMRYWNNFNMVPNTNFYIEAKMQLVSGNNNIGYGLAWTANSWENCNHFIIYPSGNFKIYYNQQGRELAFKDFSPSNAIKVSDWNVLAVEKKGYFLNYFINGQKVASTITTSFYGPYSGFVIIGKARVNVDYVLIKKPKSKINLADKVTFKNQQENMGGSINSNYSEIAPIISPDGKTLYVARKGDSKGYGEYDIYYSNKLPDGTWTPIKNIGRPLNNSGDNLVISVSPDGNTMLLEGLYDSNGNYISDKGISISQKHGNTWGIPTQIVIKNYYNLNEYESFCPTVDRKVLVMSVQRHDTKGGKDLYVSFLQNDGTYSEPLNMGHVLNTYANEGTPFIAPDNVSLYFYSEGHSGYGSADIFVSKRLDDTWTNWSQPRNLGPQINSTSWDTYYSISASGEYAYLVSTKGSYGNEDIYTIKLEEPEKPNPVVLVFGKVFNEKTKLPIEANISYENLKLAKEVGTARSNSINGEYKIVLPYGTEYGIRAFAKGFLSINENLDLTQINKYQEIEKILYLVPIEIGEKVNLKNVFFEQGRPILKKESYPELDRLVMIMKENPTMEIELGGHTDNRASDISLLYELSAQRVKAVKDYLISKGIHAKRIEGIGYGPDRPLNDNSTPENRAKNRRVEFKITKK